VRTSAGYFVFRIAAFIGFGGYPSNVGHFDNQWVIKVLKFKRL